MKKFLWVFLLTFSVLANAQYSFTGTFEDPSYSTVIYKNFGGASRTTTAACSGTYGGQITTSAAIPETGIMIDLSQISQSGNGQQVAVNVSYKKSATVAGSLSLAYFELDSETNLWSVVDFGSPVTLASSAITTCSSLAATIPAGMLQPDKIYGIGVWFQKTSTGNGNIYIDNIGIEQDASVITAPSCTTFLNPLAGATVSAGNLNVSWAEAPTAVNYKLKVGTTPGGAEVYNSTVAGTKVNIGLVPNTTYYAQVIPSNLIGDASGCAEISFSTNDLISYCGPITTTMPDATYPIFSVSMGGVTKTSASTIGSVAYEDFTATVFNLNQGVTYPLTVKGVGSQGNRFGMTVFIDWNNDGDFNDAEEAYFTSEPFIAGSSATNTLKPLITVPEGTISGNKRMRIKYNFNNSATALTESLKNPCAEMGNGQVEDYTISVTTPTAAPNCTTFISPVNGATDVIANTTLAWESATNASGYKLFVGTGPGAHDILNGIIVNTDSYDLVLPALSTIYAKVIPYNSIGSAIGCTEISFTTANVEYCGPLVYETVEPTTNVTFSGINNTTSEEVDGTPAHEFFLDQVATVLTGTNYPISLNANTDGGTFRHFFAVFIDWNQDGDFNDAGEKYFTTPDNFIFVLGSDGFGDPATGTIAVPENAKLGNTRMRVKSQYYTVGGPTTDPDLSSFGDACVTDGSAYGQVEDYTVFVKVANASTSADTKNKITLYPNPFHEVLKISDVKGVQSISISDVSGRLVKTMKATTELNLSDLNSGLYIVTLHMEDGSIKSIKAIKK